MSQQNIIAFLSSIIYLLLLSLALNFIWNFALIPAIDGLNYIEYKQAVCISLLFIFIFKDTKSTKIQNKDE